MTFIIFILFFLLIHATLKSQLFLAELFASVGYVFPKTILKFMKKKWNPRSEKGTTQNIWSVLEWEKLSCPTLR